MFKEALPRVGARLRAGPNRGRCQAIRPAGRIPGPMRNPWRSWGACAEGLTASRALARSMATRPWGSPRLRPPTRGRCLAAARGSRWGGGATNGLASLRARRRRARAVGRAAVPGSIDGHRAFGPFQWAQRCREPARVIGARCGMIGMRGCGCDPSCARPGQAIRSSRTRPRAMPLPGLASAEARFDQGWGRWWRFQDRRAKSPETILAALPPRWPTGRSVRLCPVRLPVERTAAARAVGCVLEVKQAGLPRQDPGR